jgi:hypothetical protein
VRFRVSIAGAVVALAASRAQAQHPEPAQTPAPGANPIAIVRIDSDHPDRAAKVSGALEVSEGKAIILANGEVRSGDATTEVTLPRRGTLRVCANTAVKLNSDSSVPADEIPGLMMSLDRGALEASFATGRNADILMTPDFRILIAGPGSVEVKVRLGENGDTCVDNPGADAPYVLVSSVFDGGAFRVQPGQRVLFERGSLHEVVDNEKEPCGCPPATPTSTTGNEFPLAQSEGLAPLPKLPAVDSPVIGLAAQPVPVLVHNAASPETANTPPPAPEMPKAPAPAAQPAATTPAAPPAKKPGFFQRIGKFFRRIFGAE